MDILLRDGLSEEILSALSYGSELGLSLKKNLGHFSAPDLFAELDRVRKWYERCELLDSLPVDSRIKSRQSAMLKYQRFYPDHQARKVFNDLLGFRSTCDSYEDALALRGRSSFRIADLSKGKASDDGYRGVHVYYQQSQHHWPIEIQYNTFYDRQLNNWLHKYLYKRVENPEVGRALREAYESGDIRNEREFEGRMRDVLSGGQMVR